MGFIANPVHDLTLGGLVLIENGSPKVYTDAPSGETYTFNVSGEDQDTSWGNPQPVTTTLLSMLTNGSQVAYLHDDNREPSIALTVKASGASALAAAEVALRKVTYQPAELIWQPPSASSAPTVFDIVFSRLDHKMDSLGERWFRRSYSIALQALPYGRSATKTTTPAITTAAPTVVDNGSATTNWTAPFPTGATVSAVSGAVTSTYNPAIVTNGYYGTRLRRAFPTALDVSVNKYLAVDWKTSISSFYTLNVNANPYANQSEVRREPAPTAGYTRSWYKVDDATTSLTEFYFDITHPSNTAASATLSIDQVLQANALPAQGTGRQKMAAIYPGGSAPAEGDILLQHATSALGRTIIYTHPIFAGYSPPLRPWRTSGGAVVSSAAFVSGAYDDNIATPVVYSVPVDTLPPGNAQLWAKIGMTTAGTVRLNWSTTAWQGGVAQTGSRQSGSLMVQIPVANTQYLFPIARMTLPPSLVTGPQGYVVIVIERDASSSPLSVSLDDAWLFAMDEGTLTVVECGDGAVTSGVNANRLRIVAPSLAAPYGGLRVATAADWSDTWEPASTAILCDQRDHRFNPDGSMIFTVTANALDTAVSLEHFRRWHTHAGS